MSRPVVLPVVDLSESYLEGADIRMLSKDLWQSYKRLSLQDSTYTTATSLSDKRQPQ